MALTDLLADALTRIRNGQLAKHAFATVPSSKLVKDVLEVLKDEGYILGYEEFEQKKGINLIKIDLKYYQGQPVINKIVKVSTPGRRIYTQIKKMKKYFGGLGICIVSTPKGVMSDDKARKHHVGGEILCNVF
ncbi:30S ribosomal protein S8 [endosymbiont of Acanthamoeba sp. UWC8]|uniref:Small ribosomal subunit protein uS8 n=1 Tax=Candidatus Jidaibacter acanthamoebae TaxID=86105 RepID=A0A0C1MUQ8_9RICK|nr:30S ribosomal protein S8 [Candidatus Jidaibacter acanthamoeba]AIF81719.1 30S ribosomal protein S8 [endosymbiont of Acanthamoeba sp. UWC8]KIE05837.1 30S ribosomal protein S8 [Candidatus Jidaibacter acanthamoeba]MBA8667759.1 30S ribosomal protein S8 [Holosporaceae bacterium 'Namur']